MSKARCRSRRACSVSVPKRRLNVGLTFMIAIVAIAIVATSFKETHSMPQRSTTAEHDLYAHLGYYQSKMGPKLNVHLTTHCLAKSCSQFQKANVPFDPTVATIDELIKELEKKIPGARAVLDETDKDHPVIHLIDKTLEKKTDVMERKIDFKYTGVIGNIAAALEKAGVTGIVERRGAGSSEFYEDYKTHVDIDVKDESVRDILTHSVNLDKYKWIIWTAKTFQADDGTSKTEVIFSGPR